MSLTLKRLSMSNRSHKFEFLLGQCSVKLQGTSLTLKIMRISFIEFQEKFWSDFQTRYVSVLYFLPGQKIGRILLYSLRATIFLPLG